MPNPSSDLLTSLLREVSRSFYATLRVLPGKVRNQISLAYLLARLTDTIADTEIIPMSERLEALVSLSARINGETTTPLNFSAFLTAQESTLNGNASAAERMLLGRAEEVIELLSAFDTEDRRLIRDVLRHIMSGQSLDLERFGSAKANAIMALPSDAELDDYTFRVAGCVGEFWTKICRRHLFPEAALDEKQLLADAIRFGKGLQLVNILRDLPKDLRQGRCYLPLPVLATHHLKPEDLLDAAREGQFRKLYNGYLEIAQSHLAAGWDYTNALPRNQVRVRLACAWPILIGTRTLARLKAQNVLDHTRRIKVSRAEVRSMVIRSIVYYPCTSAWKRLLNWAQNG